MTTLASTRRSALTAPLVGAGLVAVAVALVLLDAPTVVRAVVALPILVGISGLAAATLMTGGITTGRGSEERDEVGVTAAGRGVDTWVFTPLALISGVLSVLASVLVLSALGIAIGTTSVAVGTGVTALLLLTAAAIVPREIRPLTTVDLQRYGRRALPVVGAAVVIIAAVAGAQLMQPTTVEQYSTVSFSDPAAFSGAPLTSAAGTPVTLGWTLSTFGFTDDAAPTVAVTVGGVDATDPVTDPGVNGSPTAALAQASRTGSVTFDAPAAPGRYLVRVEITHADADGAAATEELTVPLQVSS